MPCGGFIPAVSQVANNNGVHLTVGDRFPWMSAREVKNLGKTVLIDIEVPEN